MQELKGSNIYSTFDMRSGYYHMVLSEKSDLKVPCFFFCKWEFKRCPFGLVQAHAYFQRLVMKFLSGLTFAFGFWMIFLYTVLYWKPSNTSMKLFIKLREADLKLKEVKCNFLGTIFNIWTYCFGKRYNTNA